jgi:hypothetical protein
MMEEAKDSAVAKLWRELPGLVGTAAEAGTGHGLGTANNAWRHRKN